MSERFLHENIYRGTAAMKTLVQTPVALCGVGAVGSNLAVNLVRQGFSSLILIDRDRVEPHNLGTQVWTEAEVGLFKAECLRNRLYDDLGLEVEARPKDGFAWFALGTNLLATGRPADAAAAYDRARFIGLPFRTMWYQFGAFQAYYESGRYEEVLALADATIRVTADVEELHYWRGRALAALGDVEGARQALQRALAQRPDFPEAVGALEQLGG